MTLFVHRRAPIVTMTTLATIIKQRPALAQPIILAQSEKRESEWDSARNLTLIPATYQVWSEENSQTTQ